MIGREYKTIARIEDKGKMVGFMVERKDDSKKQYKLWE